MRWHSIRKWITRSEEAAGIYAEILERERDSFSVRLWNSATENPLGRSMLHVTLDDAKAAALPLMRAAVISARDEAHNVVLDASRWLRANGGEP